jgi:uncharacterized protein (TIGR02266 family)
MAQDPATVAHAQTEERRRHQRVAARFEIRFGAREEAARALRAFSVNVSPGGLCMKVRKTYEVGMPLRIHMDVSGELFDLEAAVAWTRPEVIGVRFVDVKPEDRDRLQRVLQEFKR